MEHSPGEIHRRNRSVPRSGLTIAAAAALVGSTLMASPPVRGANSDTADATPHATTSPADLGLKPLPGQESQSTTVRLITGQQVTLTRSTSGQYSVIQGPSETLPDAQGQLPARLEIHGESQPGSTATTMTATPTYAQELVASLAVDPHLFDLTWLVAHGYATGTVPLVVHYAPSMSNSAVATAAGHLAGATLAGTVSGHDATVNVNLNKAAAFWNAVATTPAYTPSTATGPVWHNNPNAPQALRDGIAKLTLARTPIESHPLAQVTQPAADAGPTYQLTVRFHHFTDTARAAFFDYVQSAIVGRSGGGIDQAYLPGNVTCDDPCDTTTITYDVPAGSYQVEATAMVRHDYSPGYLTYYRPQFDLYADRTLDAYADNASWATVKTPKPSEPEYGGGYLTSYQTADGFNWFDVSAGYSAPGGWQYFLADKKPQPVTAGTFSLATNMLAQQAPVTMSEVAQGHSSVALSPSYPEWRMFYGSDPAFNQNDGRWLTYDFPDGTHQYGVVDARNGTADDFAGIDAAGKLAIVRAVSSGVDDSCSVDLQALQNALNAHAVGVLVDSTDPASPNGYCDKALIGLGGDGAAPSPAIPWAALPGPQAQALESSITKEPVSISITGAGNPSYFYVAGATYERTMPTSVTQTMTAKNLATENTTIDTLATGPEEAAILQAVISTKNWSFGVGTAWQANRASVPFHATVYVPIDQDFDEQLTAKIGHWAQDCVGVCAMAIDSEVSRNVMPTTASTSTVEYGREPITLGSQTQPSQLGAFPFASIVCDACRQGNDFIPIMDEVSGTTPDSSPGNGLVNGQLTADGTALPRDATGLGWTLPSQPTTYQLTSQSTDGDLAWTFTSAAPTVDSRPATANCLGYMHYGVTDPCAAQPLVFVRYVAPVGGDNLAPSATRQTLSINAYHAYDLGSAITKLTQQVSFDHGHTWTTVPVSKTKTAGTYTATFIVPPLAQTDGFVSLRTTASDADGNSTDQTYYDSYQLK